MTARRRSRPRARDLAARTPAERDRYVDLLRAAAICVVVLGHWTVAAVVVSDDGPIPANLLAAAPWSHPVTWAFQVMPVVFLVGGYANAASLSGSRRPGRTTAGWVRGRAVRLLRPTAVLLAALLGARLLASALGADEGLVDTAIWTAAAPLWFLVVYLAVVVLAPFALAVHRRWGLAVVAALVLGVAAGDLLRLVTGDVEPAAASYLLAWLAVHQVGIAWRDGALPRGRAAAVVLAGGGLAAAVLLTGPGPYGVTMVGAATPPDLTNTAPPTLALLALASAQLGLVLLLRPAATRWLARPRVWAAVVGLNSVVLSVFLWHMAALVVGGLVLYRVGALPQAPLGSGAWFLARGPWYLVLGLVLTAIVALVRRWEAPRPSDAAARPSPAMVGAGVGGVLVGMVSLGVSDTQGIAPQLGGVPVVELGLVGVGLALLARAGRASR